MTAEIDAPIEFADYVGTIRYPKSVLGKENLILGVFDNDRLRVKLSELSLRSGLPKPTTHRLARELVHRGLLEQQDEWYRLGARIFELGQKTIDGRALRNVARPHLADLFAETRTTTHPVMMDGDEVLFVDKIAGAADRNEATDGGRRLPVTCTASGKLLLAWCCTDDEITRRYAGCTLARPTPRSLRSVDKLVNECSRVRRVGFAVDLEENTPGHCSAAVPVVTSGNQVLAAISVTRQASVMNLHKFLPL
ncbi:IclR family transcriptional regulator [Nocardia pseudovaccinii]|uniref:IclR family transcriptional regulator n=1 Tax=Nocardia pseudovaccinii TaxID=189540 RepID=UPI003D94EE5F